MKSTDTLICQHPECDEGVAHTYEDRIGNELHLCPEHYFEAVYPGSLSTVFSRKKDDGSGFLSIFQ